MMNNTSLFGSDTDRGAAPSKCPAGVRPIAFRIAAGFLLAIVLVGLISLIFGLGANPIGLVIDAILAIGLFRLKPEARGFTLFRAYLGAILLPILAFTQYDVISATLTTIMQLGACVSLILLLQGETKGWKLFTAAGIFAVFSLGVSVVIILLSLLAKTLS